MKKMEGGKEKINSKGDTWGMMLVIIYSLTSSGRICIDY